MSARATGDGPWRLLAALYLGAVVAANALAAKLVHVGLGVHVTAGALAIPLVYLTTDLVNELYGARAAREVVWMGLAANVLLAGFAAAVCALPASPLGASDVAFAAVFRVTPRVVLASQLAYTTSSLLDVWAFAAIRRATGGRHFWLRKNGSTAVSQAVDTGLFVGLAFGGALPLGALAGMAAGQYAVKMAAAPLGTPLSYGVLALARRTS